MGGGGGWEGDGSVGVGEEGGYLGGLLVGGVIGQAGFFGGVGVVVVAVAVAGGCGGWDGFGDWFGHFGGCLDLSW